MLRIRPFKVAALTLTVVTVMLAGQSLTTLAARPNITPNLIAIRDLARDAYVWGLAPEFVYRFSHYQELVSAPVNTLKYGNNEAAWNNNATNAGDSSILYVNGFVDFNASKGERMVLTVPPTTGQYYVANYLDNFVNGIGSIGNRTTPTSTSTSYILVGPNDPAASQSTLRLNGQVYPVMASTSNLNWLLVRIRANSLTSSEDLNSVANVRTNVVQKFALNTLTQFQANKYVPVYPTTFDNFVPSGQQLEEAQAWKSAPTNALAFFTQVGRSVFDSPLPTAETAMNGTPITALPDWYIPDNGSSSMYNMPSFDQQPTLDRFAPIGLTAAGFTAPSDWGAEQFAALEIGFQRGVSDVQALAATGTAKAATNYWTYLNKMIGTYPNTPVGYIARAVVVLAGGSANVPLDAVYPTMNSNDGNSQLDGNNTYSITFKLPASSYTSYPVEGILPPMVKQNGKVAGFWSLEVYQPDASSSSAPFIPQTSALNTAYSDASSTQIVSVSGNTLTVNAPAWGPIEQSSPMVFGSNAAEYGLEPGAVYYVATQPNQPAAGQYAFELSRTWSQELSPGNVPVQQSGSLGGKAGDVVSLLPGSGTLTFGLVQPVSQLGSDQLDAGNLALNSDGSVTIWLAPTLPAGAQASNWIPTPNSAYYDELYGAEAAVSTNIQAMIRMYYPTPGDQPPSILPYSESVSTTYVPPKMILVPAALRNPGKAELVRPGVVLLSDKQAERVKDRTMVHAPNVRLSRAPVVKTEAGQPLGLVAGGLKPLSDYTVSLIQPETDAIVGTVRSNAEGVVALPVIRIDLSGRYTLALKPTAGGPATYVKFRSDVRANR